MSKKIIGSVIVASTLLSSLSFNAQASTYSSEQSVNNSPSIERQSEIEKTLATFDLNNPNKQEKKITLSNGEVATVGLEPMIQKTSKDGMMSASSLSNGQYRAYWNVGVFNCEFHFTVSKNKITKVYDGSYFSIGAVVNSAVLKLDSSKQASYYFEFGTPIYSFGGWNGWLRAKIDSNNKLSYSIK